MSKIHQLFIVLCVLFTHINSAKSSSCIPNIPCKCLLTKHSFILNNCSYPLPDIPMSNSNTSLNITKLLAKNALSRWPKNLCNYSNIQILDLSGAKFDSKMIDLSCLPDLIYLNLSNTKLETIPKLEKHLQILDLSSNNIEFIDGNSFRLLNNLISLFIQNNPLKQINHFEYLLSLSKIQFIDLFSSNSGITMEKPLTTNQWINLAYQWNTSNKSFAIRTNTIPFQSLFPNSDQFDLISLDIMEIIFKMFSNSTFLTLFTSPTCDCTHLRNYQRVFSFINYDLNLSPLFQSVTCRIANEMIHVRLFDHRAYADLNCSLIGKTMHYSSNENSCSLLNYNLFIQFFIFYLFY